jgi:hypothetical protein
VPFWRESQAGALGLIRLGPVAAGAEPGIGMYTPCAGAASPTLRAVHAAATANRYLYTMLLIGTLLVGHRQAPVLPRSPKTGGLENSGKAGRSLMCRARGPVWLNSEVGKRLQDHAASAREPARAMPPALAPLAVASVVSVEAARQHVDIIAFTKGE